MNYACIDLQEQLKCFILKFDDVLVKLRQIVLVCICIRQQFNFNRHFHELKSTSHMECDCLQFCSSVIVQCANSQGRDWEFKSCSVHNSNIIVEKQCVKPPNKDPFPVTTACPASYFS